MIHTGTVSLVMIHIVNVSMVIVHNECFPGHDALATAYLVIIIISYCWIIYIETIDLVVRDTY